MGTTEAGYFSEESGIEATLCSSVEPDGGILETAKIYQVQVSQVIPRLENIAIDKTVAKYDVCDIVHVTEMNGKHNNDRKGSNYNTREQITSARARESFVYPAPNKVILDRTNNGAPPLQGKESAMQQSSLCQGLQLNTASSPPSPLSMMDLITVGQ